MTFRPTHSLRPANRTAVDPAVAVPNVQMAVVLIEPAVALVVSERRKIAFMLD